jgi:hypothetical protein
MQPPTHARILIVANRTAAAPRLLKAVEHRAAETPCRFTLLVPDAANARDADYIVDWSYLCGDSGCPSSCGYLVCLRLSSKEKQCVCSSSSS